MAAITLATALGIASSTPVTVPSLAETHIANEGLTGAFGQDWLFVTWGNFGVTGSYVLEYTPDGGTTWVAASTAHTAAKSEKVFLPQGASVRVTGTGGTTPAVNAIIDR